MRLTIQDFRNGKRLLQASFITSLYVNSNRLYKFTRNEYYQRLDSHTIPFNNGQAGLYEINGDLYIHFDSVSVYTKVRKVKSIESRTTDEFTGFEYGKIYELENGQRWQQTDLLHAPGHHSAGNVVIFDDSILKVDSWSFYPTVTKIGN